MAFSFEDIVKYDIIGQLMTVAIDEAAAEIRQRRFKKELADMDNTNNADVQRRRQPIFADYYRS